MDLRLIKKYNVQAPRYTSYPTVPHWENLAPKQTDWKQLVSESFRSYNKRSGIALYIHLPYCESLCHYCACNTTISKNHLVERPYIDGVLKEWNMYRSLMSEKPLIKEIHLGGGTPTYFSPENLSLLIKGLLEGSEVAEDHEFSFEGHPNNTTPEHLQTLYDLGFDRVSFGIQDFDIEVQAAINRIQPFEVVKEVTDTARRIGYRSVNFDLIFGLPKQTKASIEETFEKVNQLRPDRIAFYSYAHVPWKKGWQRKFTEEDLPQGKVKRALYEHGKELLEQSGYFEIGMDHFTLQSDELYKAKQNGTLHRNFMGYNTNNCEVLIGLGVSAISDVKSGYMQNEKKVVPYLKRIAEGELPIIKGHTLSIFDLVTRKHILELMCQGKTNFTFSDRLLYQGNSGDIKQLIVDGLIRIKNNQILVTVRGLPFVRNICMALDPRVHLSNKSAAEKQQKFSLSV